MSNEKPQNKSDEQFVTEPLLGSAAFGFHPDGKPTGALAFGNNSGKSLEGSAAFGEGDEKDPLRGALLFGNSPDGDARGAAAFGEGGSDAPLRGAMLFGNDPKGDSRGALAFGNPTAQFQLLGAQAFGGGEHIQRKLVKDKIGYDFCAVLMSLSEMSLSGLRKDLNDPIRQRLICILKRHLDMDVTKLTHGVTDSTIKWGLLKRDKVGRWDKKLAERLRRAWRQAPGERLGIGHVYTLLQETERLHTVQFCCDWDLSPLSIQIQPLSLDHDNITTLAFAKSALHHQHRYFKIQRRDGTVLAYCDGVNPKHLAQRLRIRTAQGKTVGTVLLSLMPPHQPHLPALVKATLLDSKGRTHAILLEKHGKRDRFSATLYPGKSQRGSQGGSDGEEYAIGRVVNKHHGGAFKTLLEFDLTAPKTLVWSFGVIVADLANQYRKGALKSATIASKQAPENSQTSVSEIEQALGPSRLAKQKSSQKKALPEKGQEE